MNNGKSGAAAAEPFFEFDSKVREAFLPYRRAPAIKLASWLSEIGDQPQMRFLAIGTFALGAVRTDARLMLAGARMLFAHELATALKNAVKERVDRTRPRSASDKHEQKPRPGEQTDKEETSFPSGHSAGAMAVARALSAEYPRFRAAATATAACVGLAQIPRCAHYPSDVAAGFGIGIVADAVIGVARRAACTVLSGHSRK